jgi:peptide-methionine (S)-S-oxide reductase
MRTKNCFTCLMLFLFLFSACQSLTGNKSENMEPISQTSYDTATLGAGCFWCVEAIYQELQGVISVTSGYSGGTIKNPSYREVCTETTGHAEVCQLVYDPKQISFDEILEVFWQIHNPTTLNRQGNDIGTQYRSVIFYHSQEQKRKAGEYINKMNTARVFDNPVVTEIAPFQAFYKAEDYHQEYFNKNPNQPYCQLVIRPKVDKFHKLFESKLK